MAPCLLSGVYRQEKAFKSVKPVPPADDVNFFRPNQTCKQSLPKTDVSKHYDDKIIPGEKKCETSNRIDASLPQENADESFRVPFENIVISMPKESEPYVKSLTKTGGQSSLDVAIAMIGTHSITYKELSQATNGFKEDNKLGEGAFGEVFQGTYMNTKCAIKKLFEVITV